ncbi:MAG: hypothetical protein KC933_09595 [Myxococcales bacterium]|nr:hypothetical protein [Myxococcales bacterium]
MLSDEATAQALQVLGAASAARILDPIVRGTRGAPVQGVLLEDFREVPW